MAELTGAAYPKESKRRIEIERVKFARWRWWLFERQDQWDGMAFTRQGALRKANKVIQRIDRRRDSRETFTM